MRGLCMYRDKAGDAGVRACFKPAFLPTPSHSLTFHDVQGDRTLHVFRDGGSHKMVMGESGDFLNQVPVSRLTSGRCHLLLIT